MIDTQELTGLVVEAEQGRPLWHLGALLTFKALGSETDGRFWALEGLADHNMAVPLHVHSREDEVWYVLEGEIRFIVGDEEHIGRPGTVAYIPHGALDRLRDTRRTGSVVLRDGRAGRGSDAPAAARRPAGCRDDRRHPATLRHGDRRAAAGNRGMRGHGYGFERRQRMKNPFLPP